ncbi:MAG: protein adenylyltransferase SelO family protein, partial [Ilumatobacteraceae bacterium]
SSHLRVGTFQFAASTQDLDLLRRLADYAILRHYPSARDADNPYLAFYESVLDAQASLVARWMNLGFIHGVMNTDNVTISGETIDYGPCAFMDRFDPKTVFSSIDHGGRYAYGNQPMIGQWNMARFAEAIAPLIDSDPEVSVPQLVDVLKTFPDRYDSYWKSGLRTKLGLTSERADDDEMFVDLLKSMEENHVDFTSFFRRLADAARGDRAGVASMSAWVDRWLERVTAESDDLIATATAMDRVNPAYVPRNHLVEEALAAGSEGDLSVLRTLLEALTHPFAERPGFDRFAEPAPADGAPYVTYCGT